MNRQMGDDDFQLNDCVVCIDTVERHFKDKAYGSDTKYSVKVFGYIIKIDRGSIRIKVENVETLQLNKSGEIWEPDRGHVKRPPISIGGTFVCSPNYTSIDDAVSQGYREIKLEPTQNCNSNP